MMAIKAIKMPKTPRSPGTYRGESESLNKRGPTILVSSPLHHTERDADPPMILPIATPALYSEIVALLVSLISAVLTIVDVRFLRLTTSIGDHPRDNKGVTAKQETKQVVPGKRGPLSESTGRFGIQQRQADDDRDHEGC